VMARFHHTMKTGEPYQSPPFAERRRDSGVKEDYEWQLQRIILPNGERGVVCFFNNITERKQAERTQRNLDVMTASNAKLRDEIVRRQAVEKSLHASEQEQRLLLKQSRQMQKRLQEMSRQILTVQEEERKRISRELHDVIAQALVGINVHVATLAQEASGIPESLRKKIIYTRGLVEESVDIVHQFARELRPTVLDDLGLIPALKALMKTYMKDTGIRVSLKIYPEIEKSSITIRTALYRVIQEAFTNIARHAKASTAEVTIRRLDQTISMEIKDNGQGFQMNATSSPKKHNRLGLLGMKERVEMVGGSLNIDSSPGQSTTIQVEIPLKKSAKA
jgi:signal transduction histidine kinase